MLPLVLLAAMFVGNFLLEILRPQEPKGAAPSSGLAERWTFLLSLCGVGACLLLSPAADPLVAHAMWTGDGMTRVGALIVFLCLALTTLVTPRSLRASGHLGEYFALLSAAGLGMVMLMGSTNLLTLFLALELFSLALYLLCIFLPDRAFNQEAGLKYFILSSLASAILLYGMALLYGATGSTALADLGQARAGSELLLMLGGALVLAGLSFKISAVPFHVWAPDVYQGAPTPVTAFMSVATKAAALISALRLFTLALGSGSTSDDPRLVSWWVILWSLAMLSMLFGNLMALSQSHLKRLLAYSGVAQAGYLLSAVFLGTPAAQSSMLFYLLSYVAMNLGAFLVCAALEEVGEELTLANLPGLSQRQPGLTACLALCMFSLTGLPPTAGFIAKFSLFSALMSAATPLSRYLVAAALLGSLLSAGYYLKVVAQAYSPGPAPEPQRQVPVSFWISLATCASATLLLAAAAGPIQNWIALQLQLQP